MNKKRLNNFINKYHLAGLINSVIWEVNDNVLSTSFVADDRSVIGYVSMDDFEFEDAKFGVYTTADLAKIVGILDETVAIKLNTIGDKAVSLKVSDSAISTNFMLSELTIIPKVPARRAMPDWDVHVSLTPAFITQFSKSIQALTDADKFTLVYNKERNGYDIVLGFSDVNSNRISIAVDAKFDEEIEPISFSARYFKEILQANREATSFDLQISSLGLAHIKFDLDDFSSEYYLVKLKDV